MHRESVEDGVRGRRADSHVGGDEGEAPPWVVEFLATLIVTGSVKEATVEAGVDFETAWALRRKYSAFAHYWDAAVHMHKQLADPAPAAPKRRGTTVH